MNFQEYMEEVRKEIDNHLTDMKLEVHLTRESIFRDITDMLGYKIGESHE